MPHLDPSPLISIMIPVYNRESHIGACIQSALDQSYSPLEVVVVDNASSDYTWAICEAFAAKDPRVRIFRNPENLGPVGNWRRCMEEARGEYGKLLFSDDLIQPDYLETCLPLLEPDVGFVFTATEIGPAPGQGTLYYRPYSATGHYPSEEFIAAALRQSPHFPVSPGCGLFRLADLRENLVATIPSATIRDFARHGAGPDLLLYLLTAARYPRTGYVEAPVCFFRIHEGSFTISDRGRYLPLCYQAAIDWFSFLQAYGTHDSVAERGEDLLERGDLEAALHSFVTQIRTDLRSPEAYNNVGAVLWARGEAAAALGYFRAATQLNPLDPTFAENLADACVALGWEE